MKYSYIIEKWCGEIGNYLLIRENKVYSSLKRAKEQIVYWEVANINDSIMLEIIEMANDIDFYVKIDGIIKYRIVKLTFY